AREGRVRPQGWRSRPARTVQARQGRDAGRMSCPPMLSEAARNLDRTMRTVRHGNAQVSDSNGKPGALLIRWSLVRVRPGEPTLQGLSGDSARAPVRHNGRLSANRRPQGDSNPRYRRESPLAIVAASARYTAPYYS